VTIPYGRHSVSPEDIDAVNEVLRSDWLTQGPAVERFERGVAALCGARHAVAVSNGTAALHLACLAAGLGPGDSLWTSPITFVASANCALYCGAAVDFVDIHPGTWNLDPDRLEEKLRLADRDGKLPKVVVPVHFAGLSCDMARFGALARQYGFTLIEDAAHALGGEYRGQAVGSCRFSDMATFSFHPVKSITTGEGGMVLTERDDLAARLRLLRTHGITRDPALMDGASHGPWYYQQVALGYNFRLPDINAALGTSQLKRLPEFVGKRASLAERYRLALAGLPLLFQQRPDDVRSAHHLFVARVAGAAKVGRDGLFERLTAAGIRPQVHYIPVHTQPHYRRLGFAEGMFPAAEEYYRQAISLPLFPDLNIAEQERVVDAVRATLG
jgi:UDP-4-amino-4,6-dideoxy-N-acetyl-beta-L-altrosamine transaminase